MRKFFKKFIAGLMFAVLLANTANAASTPVFMKPSGASGLVPTTKYRDLGTEQASWGYGFFENVYTENFLANSFTFGVIKEQDVFGPNELPSGALENWIEAPQGDEVGGQSVTTYPTEAVEGEETLLKFNGTETWLSEYGRADSVTPGQSIVYKFRAKATSGGNGGVIVEYGNGMSWYALNHDGASQGSFTEVVDDNYSEDQIYNFAPGESLAEIALSAFTVPEGITEIEVTWQSNHSDVYIDNVSWNVNDAGFNTIQGFEVWELFNDGDEMSPENFLYDWQPIKFTGGQGEGGDGSYEQVSLGGGEYAYQLNSAKDPEGSTESVIIQSVIPITGTPGDTYQITVEAKGETGSERGGFGVTDFLMDEDGNGTGDIYNYGYGVYSDYSGLGALEFDNLDMFTVTADFEPDYDSEFIIPENGTAYVMLFGNLDEEAYIQYKNIEVRQLDEAEPKTLFPFGNPSVWGNINDDDDLIDFFTYGGVRQSFFKLLGDGEFWTIFDEYDFSSNPVRVGAPTDPEHAVNGTNIFTILAVIEDVDHTQTGEHSFDYSVPSNYKLINATAYIEPTNIDGILQTPSVRMGYQAPDYNQIHTSMAIPNCGVGQTVAVDAPTSVMARGNAYGGNAIYYSVENVGSSNEYTADVYLWGTLVPININ